jgi:putative endonuclease
MAKGGWVYIMANRYRGGMYVGVSADVIKRVYQHREGKGSAHVADFNKTRLVYVEHHDEIGTAIAREASQEMAARVEVCADRGGQSRLGRLVR